jgi:hypothetical protein
MLNIELNSPLLFPPSLKAHFSILIVPYRQAFFVEKSSVTVNDDNGAFEFCIMYLNSKNEVNPFRILWQAG